MKGTFTVPCYLFPNCGPGGRMVLDPEGAPVQNGTWTANFDCIILLSATSGPAEAARPALYGHGLLGDASEVDSSPQRSLSQEHKIVQCATDEIGMAESDVGVVVEALQDVSAFPAIPDRLQQGLLDELCLGRALISPSGFTTDPAFHQDGTPATGSVLDRSHLFYNGNSQGGIMGGALTAVSPDFTRASLGVPAMNYSVLLPRSVDFAPRTIGASAHGPVLFSHRWPGTNVLWDVPRLRRYPFTGSAIYYWDIGPIRESPAGSGKSIGVAPPPYENIPDILGEDPHGAPRGEPGTEQQLVSDFYGGAIPKSDDCGGKPCYAGGFTGP